MSNHEWFSADNKYLHDVFVRDGGGQQAAMVSVVDRWERLATENGKALVNADAKTERLRAERDAALAVLRDVRDEGECWQEGIGGRALVDAIDALLAGEVK